MRGRIVERTPGSWQLIYDLPRGADGKRKQAYLTIKGTKREAEKLLRAKLKEVDEGTVIEKSPAFDAHAERWLKLMAGHVEPTTLEGLQTTVRAHLIPYFGAKKLDAITPSEVQDFIVHLQEHGNRARGKQGKPKGGPLAGISVNRIGAVLKQIMGNGVELGLIPRNTARVRLPPAKPKRKRTIAGEDITTIVQGTRGSYLHGLIVLGLSTGLRRGELLALRWSDVNLDTGEINVARSMAVVKGEDGERSVRNKSTKTEAGERVVFLPEYARQALLHHKGKQAETRLLAGAVWQDNDLIICGEDGRPIRPSTASTRMTQRMTVLGYKGVTLHGLRHSFASLVIANGGNLLTLQKIMGHTNIKMTMGTYGHLLGGEQEAVAEGLNTMLKDVMGL